MNTEIKTFLEGKYNFEKGAELVQKYSKNAHFKRYINTGSQSNKKPYILKELNALLKTTKAESEAPTKVPPNRSVKVDLKVDGNKVNNNLTLLEQQKQEVFKELTTTRNQLEEMSDEERVKAVDVILEAEKKNKELWAKIDAGETGEEVKKEQPKKVEETEHPSVKGKSLADLTLYLKNKLASRVTNARKRLEVLEVKEGKESPKYIKKETTYNQLLIEKEAVQNRIAQLKK